MVPTSGLDEDDIDRIINEAVQSADDDSSRRQLADARNQAESLLYTSDRALAEFGEVLSDAEREMLETDLAECRQMVEEGTLEEVLSAKERLEMSAQRIGEIIYAQAGGEGEAPEAAEPDADGAP